MCLHRLNQLDFRVVVFHSKRGLHTSRPIQLSPTHHSLEELVHKIADLLQMSLLGTYDTVLLSLIFSSEIIAISRHQHKRYSCGPGSRFIGSCVFSFFTNSYISLSRTSSTDCSNQNCGNSFSKTPLSSSFVVPKYGTPLTFAFIVRCHQLDHSLPPNHQIFESAPSCS